ncbi:MAG: hypothetical protein JXB34_03875 [Bacteroidales bacterium]|nr:hypothetical protein [Bacteroidales bacterium]
MKTLRAKIKKTSEHYKNGINLKGKTVWLEITGFNPRGENNFRVKAIKSIKNGFAEYKELWVSPNDITLKHIDDGQLKLELFSPQEKKAIQYHPRYFNKRRFEVITENEKLYFNAPDHETLLKILKQYGLDHCEITQVRRLSKNDLTET